MVRAHRNRYKIRQKGIAMLNAEVGDRLIIRGHRVGEPERDAEIIEVRGDEGGPPFMVRWAENGHEALVFPGTDAYIQHFDHLDA